MMKIKTALIVLCMMAVGMTAHATNITEINGIPIQAKTGATFFVAASDYPDPNSADYVCDGTDDDVQIQAAIDAAAALTPPGSVELSSGDFGVDSYLVLPEGIAIKFFGQGEGSTVITANTQMDYLFLAPDHYPYATGTELSDFSVNANQNITDVFKLLSGWDWLISRIYVYDFDNSAFMLGSEAGDDGDADYAFYGALFKDISIREQSSTYSTPGDRAPYGFYMKANSWDNHFEDIIIANVSSAGIYEAHQTYNFYDRVHIFGYPEAYQPEFGIDSPGSLSANMIHMDGCYDSGVNLRYGPATISNSIFQQPSTYSQTMVGIKIADNQSDITLLGNRRFNNCTTLWEILGTGTISNFTCLNHSGGVYIPGNTTVDGSITGDSLNVGSGTVVGGAFSGTSFTGTNTSGSGVASVRTTTSATSYVLSTAVIRLYNNDSGDDIADGFGPGLYFQIQDNTSGAKSIFDIAGIRDGSDGSGAFAYRPIYHDVEFEAARFTSRGRLGIGDTAPNAQLSIKPPSPHKVFTYASSSYTDKTTEAGTTGGTAITAFTTYDADYLYISGPSGTSGAARPFDGMYIDVGTPGVGVTLVGEYYNGSDWSALSITDGTSALTVDGTISWTVPSDWATNSVNSTTRYWTRWHSSSSISTPPTIYSIADRTSSYIMTINQNAGDDTPAFAVRNDGSTESIMPRVSKSSAGAISAEECRGYFITITAAGTYTLPSALSAHYGAACRIRVRDAAEEVKLDPNGSEKMNLDGSALSAGYMIKSGSAAGDSITLISTDDADGSGTDGWIIDGVVGVWADNGS